MSCSHFCEYVFCLGLYQEKTGERRPYSRVTLFIHEINFLPRRGWGCIPFIRIVGPLANGMCTIYMGTYLVGYPCVENFILAISDMNSPGYNESIESTDFFQ